MNDNDTNARSGFAPVFIRFGDVEDSIPELKRVLIDARSVRASRNNLALCYLRAGDWSGAAREYNVVLQADPDSPELLYNTATAEKHRDELTASRAHLFRSVDLNPDFPTAEFEIGESYWEEGMLGEATSELQSLMKAQPEFSPAYRTLPEVLREAGDVEGALAPIEGALRIAESAAAYQELAMVEKKKGNVDDAARAFHRAEELKAQDKPRQAAKLITVTATHRIQEGETDIPVAKLKLAITLDPNYAQAHYQLARILRLKHEDHDNLAEFERAFGLNSELKTPYDLQ